jgi:metal-sulfur cluster biosynthetic enzyme
MLVAPSPKFHCQEVGEPVEVSVNCTACPAAGEAGLYVNDAVNDCPTIIVRLVLFKLEPARMVKVAT